MSDDHTENFCLLNIVVLFLKIPSVFFDSALGLLFIKTPGGLKFNFKMYKITNYLMECEN